MLRACLKLGVLLLMLSAGAVHAESVPVARAALSVGDAAHVDAAGKSQPLRAGAQLAAGDRIITGKDAIAILVFSDGGRVSLRGDSELRIQRYHVDASGAQTRLELELVRGAMRQISGEAARIQPERYRLNTPVVAIGVRGTDFLARTDGAVTETFVQEGMIVVLPKTAGCADVLVSAGCIPMAAVSASDAGRYVRVLASGHMERPVISAEDLERLFGVRVTGLGSPSGSAPGSAPAPGLVFVAGVGPDVAGSLNGRGMLQESDPLSSRVTDISAVAGTVTPDPVRLPTQLVWGRFSTAGNLPMQLPVSFAEASKGRHVTVGELGQYALWRDNPSGTLDRGLTGTASFELAAAEASFHHVGGVSPAQVQAARFGVDFDRAAFDAQVTVSHQSTGPVSLAVNGRVNQAGMFWGGSAAERVAGALSRDGKEAGFLFSRDHAAGSFRGVTLWNSR
jgi:hypothetical protein